MVSKTIDEAIKALDASTVKYRIVGGHLGAEEFKSLANAKAALVRIYKDNLYKWQKQTPLTIWKDTYTPGKRFPERDVVKTYSVDELAKL